MKGACADIQPASEFSREAIDSLTSTVAAGRMGLAWGRLSRNSAAASLDMLCTREQLPKWQSSFNLGSCCYRQYVCKRLASLAWERKSLVVKQASGAVQSSHAQVNPVESSASTMHKQIVQ